VVLRMLLLMLQFVYDGVGKSTFDSSLKCLDYLGWLIAFGNASGKPEPLDVLRCAAAAAAAAAAACLPALKQCRALGQHFQVLHLPALFALLITAALSCCPHAAICQQ
jgi:hypothetical protein